MSGKEGFAGWVGKINPRRAKVVVAWEMCCTVGGFLLVGPVCYPTSDIDLEGLM